MTKNGGLLLLLLSLFMLSACTSQEEMAKKRLQELARQTENKIARLGEHIDKGHIANTKKLQQYANIVKSKANSPEMKELIASLSLDSTSKGPIYTSLITRLNDAKSDINRVKGFVAIEDLGNEFSALNQAAAMDNYGWMLTDPINVLADMSNGQLPRVEAMSKQASLQANGAQDYGSGSQLVGNPTYGHWQTNSSGQSFWAWYGQYAFFSSMFHRPIYYSNWASHRDYSYYHSAGRYQYTSRNQQKSQQAVQQRTQKKFQKSGKSFSSPYAKNKTGSSRAAAQRKKTTRSFQSSYSSGSSRSKSKSSFGSVNSRNSSSRNSRSFSSRGK